MKNPDELFFCSVAMAESSHTPLICIVVINMLLAVTAFVGNLLILVALGKDSSLHPPSKLLLRNLAASDLFVGILAEPTFLAHWVSVLNKKMKFCLFIHRIIYVTGNMLCAVSILTMTTIAVERLLALTLGLRYRQIVTLKRTFVLLMLFWVLSIAGSTLHLVTLAISYLPYIIVAFFTTALGISPAIYLARQITIWLIFLNSSLNPVLYWWKIKEVRNSVNDTVTKLCHF
ncbi:adenosine receptor A2b-like [Montipora capricornis]|uniref:adenosine receptor A2b-like n=1 Tax=Montipora capricornis TaxID=246305 RepID=UPI0035F165A0